MKVYNYTLNLYDDNIIDIIEHDIDVNKILEVKNGKVRYSVQPFYDMTDMIEYESSSEAMNSAISALESELSYYEGKTQLLKNAISKISERLKSE